MESRITCLFAGLCAAAACLVAGPAFAQSESESESEEAPAPTAVDRALEGDSPAELPGENYYFVGLRYRPIIVPKFMINLFGEGGRTVVAHVVGPEVGIRKDGFETLLSMAYASYRMKPTPFKANDDPVTAWEIAESKLSMLYLTVDFLWSQELSPTVAINYGLGAGFGLVFGDLIHEQAYAPPGAQGPEDYEVCSRIGDPRDPNGWCGDDHSERYDGYTEPSWANGGSKPNVFPWLAFPMIGLRVKPHSNFVARFDAGFSTSGFFFGLGADYGI